MIVVDCAQGTPEWFKARSGIPTASCFSRILTPKGLKLSASREKYMHELLYEWICDSTWDPYVSEWMERGSDLEDQAYAAYEFERSADVRRVGLCKRDDGWVGCSPDGLVGDDGGLELKCPTGPVHVANMLNMQETYRLQVQGSLWITGRRWWDLMSFHPDMPSAVVRFERDEECIAKIEAAVGKFLAELHWARGVIVERGWCDRPVGVMPGLELSAINAELT